MRFYTTGVTTLRGNYAHTGADTGFPVGGGTNPWGRPPPWIRHCHISFSVRMCQISQRQTWPPVLLCITYK